MNFEQMVAELDRVVRQVGYLKKADIRISSGSAMMFYSLREETGDIDAAVPDKLFQRLLDDSRFEKISFESILNKKTRYIVKVGKVDFHNEGDTPEFNGPTRNFGGYRVDLPSTTLLMKQALNRPKDQADIALLKSYKG